MANLTKVSPYRSGAPRFGLKAPAETWDRSVKEYKLTPEQLQRYLAGTPMEEILKEEGEEMSGKPKVIGYGKYEELLKENEKLKFQLNTQQVQVQQADHQDDEEIEKLKKEVIDAHKLVTEMKQAKEDAENNVLVAKNQLTKLKEVLDEKTNDYEYLTSEYEDLWQEVHALRTLALLKIQDDVGKRRIL